MTRAKVRPLGAALAFFLILAATTDATVRKTRKRVVCYYTNWSVYRLGLAKFQPANINPYLCTHLIYAFGSFNEDFELEPADKYQDIEKGGYARFNGLKQYNKGLRTLLAIGGWNEGSGRFSEMVANPEHRKTFILSVMRYLRQYHFDGLDLDWEYPGSRTGSDFADKENYAVLCEELRAAFDAESLLTNRPALLLTVAVPAGIATIEKGFDVPRLNAAVNFFNILAYDYHASTEALTDHHAPLLPAPGTSSYDHRSQLNVDYTVRFYLKLGAERRKLVVGIPTYGRSYTLIDERFNGLQAAAAAAGTKGKSTKEDGYLSFYEVCEHVAVGEWKVYRPYPEAMGPYATKANQWVGYDDEFVVAKKAEYVRDNHLGGIMFWSIDNDDFRGRCSGRPYPLIEAAKDAYLAPAPGDPPKQAKGPTPVPPVTPDPGAEFSCKREGFFAHPTECNKYFWCLSGGPLGIVANSFTCPNGLLFNRRTDSCDFPRNVKCKVEVKETESITFPPTEEPTVLPDTKLSEPGDVTPDPFDQYYEDYDTADLPPLDLDLDVPSGQPAPLPTDASTPGTSTQQVLGSSRGAGVESRNQATELPPENESDPEELRKLLQLITDLGGVEAVQTLLEEGDPDVEGATLSQRDRQTLIRIVGRPHGAAAEPRRTTPTTESPTPRVATPAPPADPAERRPLNGRPRLSLNRRRRPEGAAGGATERPAAGRRRRPQYSSIQRDRAPTTTDASVEVASEVTSAASGGRRQYVTLKRQRPTEPTSASEEPRETATAGGGQAAETEQNRKQYVTLRKPKPTAATDTEHTTAAEEVDFDHVTQEVGTESTDGAPAAEGGLRSGGSGPPRDAASDSAGVRTLLDLTDDAANSVEREPKRRIRIHLRRTDARRRGRTEPPAEGSTEGTTENGAQEVTESLVQVTTESTTEAGVEAQEEVTDSVTEAEEENAEDRAEGVADLPQNQLREEAEASTDKEQPKIRVIRLKRPREQQETSTPLPSELRDNEATLQGLGAVGTADARGDEALSTQRTSHLDSVRLEPHSEEPTITPKAGSTGSRERLNAIARNALPTQEGIKEGTPVIRADPGRPTEGADFTSQNTLRRLGSRRRGISQTRSSPQGEEDQIRQNSPGQRNRLRSGLRRQRVRPEPETIKTPTQARELNSAARSAQEPARDAGEAAYSQRGLRRITLRGRGRSILRGRSRDSGSPASSVGTTQVVTDVQAATEAVTAAELPDVINRPTEAAFVLTTADATTIASESVTDQPETVKPVSTPGGTTETIESSAHETEVKELPDAGSETKDDSLLQAQSLKTEGEPSEEKLDPADAVGRPLRRGLFGRIRQAERGGSTASEAASAIDQLSGREGTLRRLRKNGERNGARRGTIRRRLRQRVGLRRQRPEQRQPTTTEGPALGEQLDENRSGVGVARNNANLETNDNEGAISSLDGSISEQTNIASSTEPAVPATKNANTPSNGEEGTRNNSELAEKEELNGGSALPIAAPPLDLETEDKAGVQKPEGIEGTHTLEGDNPADTTGPAVDQNASETTAPSSSDLDNPDVNLAPTEPNNFVSDTSLDAPAVLRREEITSTAATLKEMPREENATSIPTEASTKSKEAPTARGVFRLRGLASPTVKSEAAFKTDKPTILSRDRPLLRIRNRLRSRQRIGVTKPATQNEGGLERLKAAERQPSGQELRNTGIKNNQQLENVRENSPLRQKEASHPLHPQLAVEKSETTASGAEQSRPHEEIPPLAVPSENSFSGVEEEVVTTEGTDIVPPIIGRASTDFTIGIGATTVAPSKAGLLFANEAIVDGSRAGNNDTIITQTLTEAGDVNSDHTETVPQSAAVEAIADLTPGSEGSEDEGTEATAIPIGAGTESQEAENSSEHTSSEQELFREPHEENGSPLRHAVTESDSIDDRFAILGTSLGSGNTTPQAAASPTDERRSGTAGGPRRPLRQQLLAGRRDRPDPLTSDRRRPNPLAARRPSQRPLERGLAVSKADTATGASAVSSPIASSTPVTEAGPVVASEPSTELVLLPTTEESELAETTTARAPSSSSEAPFRRTFGGPRKRPFPFRPPSSRRSSLGSQLRDRLAASTIPRIGSPKRPLQQPELSSDVNGKKLTGEIDADVVGETDIFTSPNAQELSPITSSRRGESEVDSANENNDAGIPASNDEAGSESERPPQQSSERPPRLGSFADQIRSRLDKSSSTQPASSKTFPTSTTPATANSSTEIEDEIEAITQSTLQSPSTRRSIIGGRRRSSLRERLAGLSSHLSTKPSPLPAPALIFTTAAGEESGSDETSDPTENPPTARAQQPSLLLHGRHSSSDVVGEGGEIKAATHDIEHTTVKSSADEETTLGTFESGTSLAHPTSRPSLLANPPSLHETPKSGINRPSLSSNQESNSEEDVELDRSGSTERAIPTRRSALLRFSSRSRDKPLVSSKVSLPPSVETQKNINNLGARLASQSNNNSPLINLRNRLKAQLAASIGVGASSGLHSQTGAAASSTETPTDSFSSDEVSSVAIQTNNTDTTESQLQATLSTTESAEDRTTAYPEISTTFSILQGTTKDAALSTEGTISDESISGTTEQEEFETTTTNSRQPETQEDLVNKTPEKTATVEFSEPYPTSTSTSTTTEQPRKLSLVQQLRQRQQQKKSSVRSLVEQLRSTLYGSQKKDEDAAPGVETEKPTSTTEANEENEEAASTELPSEVAEDSFAVVNQTPTPLTTEPTSPLLESTPADASYTEIEYAASTTPGSPVVITDQSSIDGTHSQIGLTTETNTEIAPTLGQITTELPPVEDIVFAEAVNTYTESDADSATESGDQATERLLGSTTRSPSGESTAVHANLSQGIVYSSTPRTDTSAIDIVEDIEETDLTTISPSSEVAKEYQFTTQRTDDPGAIGDEEHSGVPTTPLIDLDVLTSVGTEQIDGAASVKEDQTNVLLLTSEEGNKAAMSDEVVNTSTTTVKPSITTTEVLADDLEDNATTVVYQPTTLEYTTTTETGIESTEPSIQVGREGRLIRFDTPVSELEEPVPSPPSPFEPAPTDNPGSFVSVKVSVSSSIQERPETTESVQFLLPTRKTEEDAGVSALDTLFEGSPDESAPTTESTATTTSVPVIDFPADKTEIGESLPDSDPIDPSVTTGRPTTTGLTIASDDVFVVEAETLAPEVSTVEPSDQADVAGHAIDRPQEASLVHVLQQRPSTPAEPKPTLYNRDGLLAFSTVTPRYRDPNSLFKRKTYLLSSAAAHQSPLVWVLGICSLLVLWCRL